jgi:predicted nucleic acid-binding protein
MRVLVDTNILTRSSQPNVLPASAQAVDALEQAPIAGRPSLPCASGALRVLVVATRPIAQNGLELLTGDVWKQMERLTQQFELIHDTVEVFDRWMTLIVQHDIKSKRAHDVRLVAAALAHGLDAILTFNDSDFSRVSQIKVLTPQRALAS